MNRVFYSHPFPLSDIPDLSSIGGIGIRPAPPAAPRPVVHPSIGAVGAGGFVVIAEDDKRLVSHSSAEAAAKEATRLSAKQTGKKFVVLGPIAVYETPKPIEQRTTVRPVATFPSDVAKARGA